MVRLGRVGHGICSLYGVPRERHPEPARPLAAAPKPLSSETKVAIPNRGISEAQDSPNSKSHVGTTSDSGRHEQSNNFTAQASGFVIHTSSGSMAIILWWGRIGNCKDRKQLLSFKSMLGDDQICA